MRPEWPSQECSRSEAGKPSSCRKNSAFRPEVEIFKRGDELVLREKARDLGRASELVCALPEDVLEKRTDDLPQVRGV